MKTTDRTVTPLSSKKLDRRTVLRGGVAALAGFPMLTMGSYKVFAQSERRYSAKTIDILQDAVVLDMLAPLVLEHDFDFFARPMTEQMKADFRASNIHLMHNATGIGGPGARDAVLSYFAGWSGWLARHSDLFRLIGSVEDIHKTKADGKVGVMMGVQNAEHFASPDDVQYFYDLGQRCAQLTYNTQNLLGSGATDRVDGGLSDFGAQIVAAMNRSGMLVDVSHCGPLTTLDAIEASDGPISITHSNCKALNDHPRLKSDEAIIKLAKRDGVMGMTGVRMFVKGDEPTTIEHFVDHIDHAVKLVGIDHVGIGTDADLYGYDAMSPTTIAAMQKAVGPLYGFREKTDIEGLDHPQKMFDLTETLLNRGYGADNIKAILGGNFLRLLEVAWTPKKPTADPVDDPSED